MLCQRKESEREGRRETTRVGNVLCFLDLVAVDLGETIDEISVGDGFAQAEVLAEVDDPGIGVERFGVKKLFALTMTQAEEDDVNRLAKRVAEGHGGLSDQIGMSRVQGFTRIASAVDEF